MMLHNVYLAGSFGGGIDVRSAAEIGLLPRSAESRGIVTAVGNTSLKGAAAYIFSERCRRALDEVKNSAVYIELSSTPDFTSEYVSEMGF